MAEELGRQGFARVALRVFPGGHALLDEELAALAAWWLGRPGERGSR